MRELPADTVVDGRYRIVSRLGSGGMADVYCAEDSQLGRRVALKVLYGRFAEDAEFVERFRREASHAAGLQHQHVVSVYDRGEWDGTSYIAMEYIDGRTLKQVIQAEAPMDPIRAIDLAVQVLRAARFAHRRGVIHRDLKPHNVMVDAEGRAKVTDFGIARAGASDMTQTGSIMGTAQYLSPEQAQGHPVTPQSDLYSIGICLYEMLTGRIPFDGESAVTIALKQVSEAPVPPSHYNSAIPGPLEDAVLRALAKNPEERFSDADAFIAALEDAKAQIQAGSAPPAQPTASFTTIPDEPLAVQQLYSPATGAEALAYGPVPVSAPRTDDDGPKWPWLLLISVLVVGAIVGALLLTGTIGAKKVTVPSVVRTSQSAATAVLHRKGLNVHFDFVTSDEPQDTVISQDPPAGTQVKKNTTVNVTISNGPGNRQIPVVDGLTRRAARKKLTTAGFKIQEHSEFSNADPPIAAGHVTHTVPSGGNPLPIGSTVDLYISRGAQPVDIPDVTSQNIDDARATLTGAGFKVATIDKPTTDRDPGTVLAESPSTGQAPMGATITLTVAKAPDKVEVPDETGKLEAHAVTDLSRARFTVDPQSQDTTDPTQDGRVISQTPSGGDKAKPNSPVTIVVGHFVQTTTPTTPTTTTPR